MSGSIAAPDGSCPIPDSLAKSYRLPKGPRTLAMRVRMPHGHGGPGEKPEEIRVLADSLFKSGTPLAWITAQGRDGQQLWVAFQSQAKIVKAELNFTADGGPWEKRKWETIPAEVDAANGKATGTLPAGAKVGYLNLVDERGCVASTEYVEAETPVSR